MKTAKELMEIVSCGGGVIIDSSVETKALLEIASYASDNRSRVIIKGAGSKSTEDLKEIASYGKGAVIFDFTE